MGVEPWLQGAPAGSPNQLTGNAIGIWSTPGPSRNIIYGPMYVILLVSVFAIILSLYAKRTKKISMFIPVWMIIIAAILAFLYFVPLPLKRICDFGKDGNLLHNCEPVYITSWNRFLETYGSMNPASDTMRRYPGNVIQNLD